MRQIRSYLSPIAAAAMLSLISIPASAVSFNQINLVTDDQTANRAQLTDPDLKNAWGMTAAPGEDFWVSANGSGKALLYKVDPATQATTKDNLTISIPGNGSVTGQASSYGSPNFAPDNRTYNSSIIGQPIFVSEDGIISSWTSEYIYVKNPEGCGGERNGCDPSYTTGAMHVIADLATANYKGAASASAWGGHYLYAANFKAGTIDVFKGETSAPPLTGTFTDPESPQGLRTVQCPDFEWVALRHLCIAGRCQAGCRCRGGTWVLSTSLL